MLFVVLKIVSLIVRLKAKTNQWMSMVRSTNRSTR